MRSVYNETGELPMHNIFPQPSTPFFFARQSPLCVLYTQIIYIVNIKDNKITNFAGAGILWDFSRNCFQGQSRGEVKVTGKVPRAVGRGQGVLLDVAFCVDYNII